MERLDFKRSSWFFRNSARFAGTGSFHAHECWRINGDAKKAVNSAKQVDWFSGGSVAFVDFSSGQDNLKNSTTISDVQQFLLDRGMVMYKTNKAQTMPVKDAAANDDEVKKVADAIANGEIIASAPCDAMYNSWSDDDIEKLSSVLDEIYS
jgi:hypothetical protein